MRFLKPIDEEILDFVGKNFKLVLTVEDGVKKGGLGSAVMEYMAEHNLHPIIKCAGLPDSFVEHGAPNKLYHLVGLDKEGIRRTLGL